MNTQNQTSPAEEIPVYVDQMNVAEYWADTLNNKVLPILRLSSSSDLPPDTENQVLNFLEWVEENPNTRLEQITQSPDMANAVFVINQYLEHLGCDLVDNSGTVLNISDENDAFDIDVTDTDGNVLETEVYFDSYSAINNVDECLTFADLTKKIQEKFAEGGSEPVEQIIRGSRFKTQSLMAVPPSLPQFNSDSAGQFPVIPNSKGNVPPPCPSSRDKLQLVFSVGVGQNTPPEYEEYEVIEDVRSRAYRMTG